MRDAPDIGATVLGYPRIGPDRELKRALESYWAGRIDRAELETAARELRQQTWRRLSSLGLDSVPGNTFSYYDHVLDAAVLVGAVPERLAGDDELDTYFAMARGTSDAAPLEMTKWFDTNYHYLVPEIGPSTTFTLANTAKPVAEYREARTLDVETRPVLVGPVSFLLLSKPAEGAPDGFTPLDRLDDLVEVYRKLLTELAAEGTLWVQLDEPVFVADRTDEELAALSRAYQRLASTTDRPAILVASYFGDLGPALRLLAATPVEAIAVDLVAGGGDVDGLASVSGLRDKTVVAGVVDGRNVWRTDLEAALAKLGTLLGLADRVAVSSSCSLLHVPYDVGAETQLDPQVKSWLAFADQKVTEVVTLARGLREGREAFDWELGASRQRREARTQIGRNAAVRARLEALRSQEHGRAPYADRVAEQRERMDLPTVPTTTLGSFPQTSEVRQARAAFRNGRIDAGSYRQQMRAEIERVVRLQERLGLDVLVHGEPERNDMVQYFAENLDGFAATSHGWVQSYGSRCVRPPILYGDVGRPAPITVEWTTYAQSLTDRPVKGMLTGPVTILAWSFVRDDQSLAETARQVALALRDEAHDLEAAGIRIVQVDEPALRELLPLRAVDQARYLDWAVNAFRMVASGVSNATQIHTHLCYSEFGDILEAIDALDADVTYIEAARSRMELLPELARAGFSRGVGPGVYDIHSPRVPATDELHQLLRKAAGSVPAGRLWANPDCGLKTRTYTEVEPTLEHLVAAAASVRDEFTTTGSETRPT